MRMKNIFLGITMLAMLVLVSNPLLANSNISLNLSEAANQNFAGGQFIGPLATNSSNWNTTISPTTGNNVTGTRTGLKDAAGVVTDVNASWTCSNCWWNTDGTSDDQHKLSTGYMDDGGNGVLVTFTNIPYGSYRVFGLFSTDQNYPNTVQSRNFQVNGIWVYGGNDTTTATAYGGIVPNNTNNGVWWTKIVPGVTVGNYWTIDTSGSTLTIDGLPRSGSNRGCLAGVIIEELDPFLPYGPDPSVGEEVTLDQVLTWQQDSSVAGQEVHYNVYFGTDSNSLSPTYYGLTPVKTTSDQTSDFNFDPELANSTKYYWRVDALEPNEIEGGNPSVHTGFEWWFTTVPPDPRIEVGPVSQTVPAGTAQVVLTVEAINSTLYQWYKDGVALTTAPSLYSGQNTDTLTIYDVQLADEGFYYCVADSDLNKPAASASAQVMTARLTGWWKLDGNLTDSVATVVTGAPTHEGTSPDPNYVVTGKDSGSLEFFGDVGSLVTISDSNDFFNFYPQGYTISAWVNMPTKSGWGAYVAKQGTNPARGFILTHNNTGQAIHTLRQSFNDLGSNRDVDDSAWHLVTGTYDASLKQGKVYVDGVLRNQATSTGIPAINSAALIFGAELSSGAVAYRGKLDDVRIWSYPLDKYAIAELYAEFTPGAWICTDSPGMDINGPEGVPDCKVNLYDFAKIAANWLDCGLVPETACD